MTNPIIKKFFFIIIVIEITACNFNPGSYPYAEQYELDLSYEKAKMALLNFKKKHPEYMVPKVNINGKDLWNLQDEQTQAQGKWYKCYFYYKDENKIILTLLRYAGKNKTNVALVSINNGLRIGNWKDINKDFSNLENREEKRKFEIRILKQLK